MRNNSEKGILSDKDVIPAMAAFLEEAAFQNEIKELPVVVREMFENILDTDSGNDLAYRQRIMGTLRTVQSFATSMAPFSNQQIVAACQAYHNE